jgi:serine/threonine-protein kinase RsbW
LSGETLPGIGLRDAEVVGDELRLTLSNTLDAVAAGRAPLFAFVEGRGFTAQALNRLDVIFEELVSNTVRHGFSPGSGQSIRVRARFASGELTMVFEDDGAPFDPTAQKPPRTFSTLEAARPGGLGLLLVTRFASRVRYERPAASPGEFAPTNRVSVVVAAV